MGRRRTLLALALFLGAWVSAGNAGAAGSEKTAAENFQAGVTAYAHGEFRAAAALFEGAYRTQPRGAAVYNAGLAWESAGEPTRAADAYAAALARSDLSDEQGRDARTRLAALERSLGRLHVTAPAGTSAAIDRVSYGGSVAAHVLAGDHEVQVVFGDGRGETRRVVVAAGSLTVVEFMTPPSPPVSRAAVVVPPKPRPHPPAAAPAPLWSTFSRGTVGWIALGASVPLVATAGVLGQSALRSRDDYDASGHTNQGLRDTAASLRLWTNVAWIAGAAAAGAGIYLLLTPTDTDAAAATEVRLGPGDVRLRVLF